MFLNANSYVRNLNKNFCSENVYEKHGLCKGMYDLLACIITEFSSAWLHRRNFIFLLDLGYIVLTWTNMGISDIEIHTRGS